MQRPLSMSNASRSSSGSSGTFLSASDGTTFTTPSGQDSCHRSHKTTTVAQSEALPSSDPLDCLMKLQIRSAISSKRYANQRHNSQSSGNISRALPPTIKDPSLGLTPTPKVSLPLDMNSSRYAMTMAAVMKADDLRSNLSLSKKPECGGSQNSRVPFPLALEDNSQGSSYFEKKSNHKTPHWPHPGSLREQCDLEKHREIEDRTHTLHGVSDPKLPLKWESTEDYEEPLATVNYEQVPAVTKGLKPLRSTFSFHSFFGAGQQVSRSSNISRLFKEAHFSAPQVVPSQRKLERHLEDPSNVEEKSSNCTNTDPEIIDTRFVKIQAATGEELSSYNRSVQKLEPLPNLVDENEAKNSLVHKVIKLAGIKLGTGLHGAIDHDLGDSMWISNPALEDNPIVMVAPGFLAATGYTREEVLGRNIRFLHGKHTDPLSLARIQESFQRQESCTEILLYYHKDGSPFHCLVNIIPLFDIQGDLTYIIGGQVKVSGDFELFQHLASTTPPKGHLRKHFYDEKRPTQSLNIRNLRFSWDTLAESSSSANIVSNCGSALHLIHACRCKSRSANSPLGLITEGIGKHGHGRIDLLETVGAERLLGSRADPVNQQVKHFEAVYSRIIIFERKSRQIVFATGDALAYLGVPVGDPSQVYSSVLLQTDFLNLVVGADGKDRKRVYSAISRIVKKSISASFSCHLHFELAENAKSPCLTVLHLTPLFDSSGRCKAYSVTMEPRHLSHAG